MAKKWTKRELFLLKKAYDDAVKSGNRIPSFPKELMKNRKRHQCLWQAKRLKINRKKGGGFGLIWNRKFSESEKFYIAGILDGEGYICNNYSNYLVGVVMTDRTLIEWLQKKVGGSFSLRKRRMGKIGKLNKQQYEWRMNGMKQVKSILMYMLPCLRVKKNRAIFIIKEIDKKSL